MLYQIGGGAVSTVTSGFVSQQSCLLLLIADIEFGFGLCTHGLQARLVFQEGEERWIYNGILI